MYLRLQYVKQEREVATSGYHHLEYGTMLTEKDGMAFHLKSAPHEQTNTCYFSGAGNLKESLVKDLVPSIK